MDDRSNPAPPAGHPFLRPAIPVATNQSPLGNGSSPTNTSYYRPLALGPDSEAGTASSRPESANSRPESRASGGARSRDRPPSRAFSPNSNGAADTNATATSEPPRKLSRWEEKVQGDLAGWRGGHGPPHSGVPQAGVPSETYYGQPTTGTIGKHLPKEIVRIERDWTHADICQFSTTFPLELESRLTPTVFSDFVESINAPLREAYSTKAAIVDNLIAVATWWTSLAWRTGHFEKELRRAEEIIREANEKTFNSVGLNVLTPRYCALQYLEIE